MKIQHLLIGSLAIASLWAQAPAIDAGGVTNAASYIPNTLSNGAIAQGARMRITGRNLGPAEKVEAQGFPLERALAGTRVQVRVGATPVDCFVLSTSATEVIALLPSNAQTGTAQITVSYNDQPSGTRPIRILARAFGIYTSSRGAGLARAKADGNAITRVNSAKPGQTVELTGTGLGPVQGDESAGPLPGDQSSLTVEVFVGSRPAEVLYRGRSETEAGNDTIRFVVPSGIEGCGAAVAVKIANQISNFASLPVAANGGTCANPLGFGEGEISGLGGAETVREGSINLSRVNIKLDIPIPLPIEPSLNTESGSGSFFKYTFDQFVNAGDVNPYTFGSCFLLNTSGETPDLTPDNSTLTPLDAGPVIRVTGPNGSRELKREQTGFYSGSLSEGGANPLAPSPAFLVAGTYKVSADGGEGENAVGPFSVDAVIPEPLTWTNRDAITRVNRAAGQEVTWTGGDPSSYVIIAGSGSAGQGNDAVSVNFVCLERASAGRFTIPAHVLLAVPATAPSGGGLGIDIGGFLLLGNSTDPARFQASGLDLGIVSSTSLSGRTVTYQ